LKGLLAPIDAIHELSKILPIIFHTGFGAFAGFAVVCGWPEAAAELEDSAMVSGL
jgi:hypothetical protein